jgi:hypothetical protein
VKYCARCANERWVCEAHDDRPWGGEHGCTCGAAGEPCPICNKVGPEAVPEIPDGFVVDTAASIDPLANIDPERESLGDALARVMAAAAQRHRKLH